eukprot:11903443-Ditylum_brightwellii.AAC.1
MAQTKQTKSLYQMLIDALWSTIVGGWHCSARVNPTITAVQANDSKEASALVGGSDQHDTQEGSINESKEDNQDNSTQESSSS